MKCLAVFCCLLCLHTARAQSPLSQSIDQLIDLVGKVEVKDDTYDQMLTSQPDAPYRMTLRVTEIDRKGREERMEYRFNLALMSPNQVRWEDGRNRIQVSLQSGNEPVIQVFENDEMDTYEDELLILAEDIDNARALQEAIQDLIPLARESWEAATALPNTFEGLLKWVEDQVGDVSTDDESYRQSWRMSETYPSRVIVAQDAGSGRRNDAFVYSFNLTDIDASKIAMDVKGAETYVEIESANRLKYIRVEENGVLEDYEDRFRIYCSNPEGSQLLAYALRKLPSLARERYGDPFEPVSTVASAGKALIEGLADFTTAGRTVRQSMTGDCQATYERRIDDGGDVEPTTLRFDFADLDSRSVTIVVRGTEVNVEVETRDGRDFIYVSEEGEQQNYDDEIAFPAASIPAAKRMAYYLRQLIELCPTDLQPGDWSDAQRLIEAGPANEADLRQAVDQRDDNPCKWQVTITEDKGKSVDEMVYEFNLYDLNSDDLAIDVKGKSLIIELKTRRGDDIIKAYENGEDDGFTDDFDLHFSDVPSAKLMQITLREMIRGCSD
jgi:hypothetical protein